MHGILQDQHDQIKVNYKVTWLYLKTCLTICISAFGAVWFLVRTYIYNAKYLCVHFFVCNCDECLLAHLRILIFTSYISTSSVTQNSNVITNSSYNTCIYGNTMETQFFFQG